MLRFQQCSLKTRGKTFGLIIIFESILRNGVNVGGAFRVLIIGSTWFSPFSIIYPFPERTFRFAVFVINSHQGIVCCMTSRHYHQVQSGNFPRYHFCCVPVSVSAIINYRCYLITEVISYGRFFCITNCVIS